MLDHAIKDKGHVYLNNECPMHGADCPNNGRGILYVGKILSNHSSTTGIELRKISLEDLFKLAKCDCIIAATLARCALSRRMAIHDGYSSAPGAYLKNYKIGHKAAQSIRNFNKEFADFIKHNLWYIVKNAHVRIKISIIDTLAEIPGIKPEIKAAAIASSTIIKSSRLARTVTNPKSEPIEVGVNVNSFRLDEGIRFSCDVASDTAQAMLMRLRSLLFDDPLVWILSYEVIKHDMEDQKHIFNTADNIHYYRLYDQGPTKLKDAALKYLKPSCANLKYMQLYKEHHRNNSNYGNSSFMPEMDKSFLLDNKCQKVMDYGCGKVGRNDRDFTWVKYDPCIAEHSTPYNDKVDGLVCYDVLEHIPLNELDVFAKWVSLYSPRAVVLGICTRTAAAVLRNGENAHCTVQNAEWWVKWAKKAFVTHLNPDIELKSFSKCRDTRRLDFVTLHIKSV